MHSGTGGERKRKMNCENKCDTCTLSTIVKEIEEVGFICEAGSITNHRGFIALKKLAEKWSNISLKASEEQELRVANAFLECIKTGEKLKVKTNEEIALLVINHIQSQFNLLSPQYELLDAVIDRLAPDLDLEKETQK
jgi:hypothetical protein